MSYSIGKVISFFCFLLLVVHVEHGAVGLHECPESRCGHHTIRFPFRLKSTHQPDHCGYPGFDLSCTNDQRHALLELPTNSVKLFVRKFDYKSQLIYAYDPQGCLPRQLLNFNLSTSPFQIDEEYINNFTLFSCSSTKRSLDRISCLSAPGAEVYAVDSDASIQEWPLSGCTKMHNSTLSVPYAMIIHHNIDLHLNWSKSICRDCEAEGKLCKLKDNSTEPAETECYPKPKRAKGTSMKFVTTGVILGSFLLLLAIIAFYRVYSLDKIEKQNQAKINIFLEDYRALKPARYSYADLKRITNQFKEKLGQGAYGTVFKGKLSNEILVAVKMLNDSKGNGEEFINEVGTIGRIHHVNVVRLVGFCADRFRRALVYEYLPNESLEKFIFSGDGKNPSLGWEELQDISLGIARGIEYLHQGCDQQILHFDIKPHNVLLDENFNPKISDFGLAKLCSKDQSVVSMTAARGRWATLHPKCFRGTLGMYPINQTVYSFGMMLLEMVGGRKNIDVTVEKTSQVYFPRVDIQSFGSRRRAENPG